MFIENKQYRTDNLSVINELRKILLPLYNITSNIIDLRNAITRNINCEMIDYSYNDFTFTLKVNKSIDAHSPNTYYGIICNIFKEFIISHEQEIIREMRNLYEDPYKILYSIYDNHHIMANLCHITCINDGILYIML